VESRQSPLQTYTYNNLEAEQTTPPVSTTTTTTHAGIHNNKQETKDIDGIQ